MSMRTAITGLSASQIDLSTIANNIANAATTGFKASRTEFANMVSADGGGTSPGSGVRVTGVVQQFRQGGLEYSGNALDLAINGTGFFVLKDAGGGVDTYTRVGSFTLDKQGYVASSTGQRLLMYPGTATTGATSTIQANIPKTVGSVDYPVTRLEFSASGALRATYENGDIATLGTVALATFPAPGKLMQMGDTRWGETESSGTVALGVPGAGERGLIESGMLEASNVEITEQLVDMITAQRNFQANAKTITTADQVAQAVLNIR